MLSILVFQVWYQPLWLSICFWEEFYCIFLQRDDQEMQSPGSKHIKMLLVQMLHFRKVKPQQFRLLNFPVSHHVRHLESGYLIWKGKMLAQLVTCGRVRWGGPGWCVCSPGKGHGAHWCCRGQREAVAQCCCQGYQWCWKKSAGLKLLGRSDLWTWSWVGPGDLESDSEEILPCSTHSAC